MEQNEVDHGIQKLIETEQYSLKQKEKEEILIPLLKAQIEMMKDKNPHLKSMYEKVGISISGIQKISDIPFIPVQMFKKFDLATRNKSEIIRVLKSSSTTGQSPSQIPLDKLTASRQTLALTSTLSGFLGTKRRPFLVIDSKSANMPGEALTARGAGIRGFSTFAKTITYALKENPTGDMELDYDVVREFFEKHKGQEIFAFGFTFMVWTKFVRQLEGRKDLKAEFSDVKVFHSGGWKKLKDQQVSEDFFSKGVARIFGTKKENVLNFYGMVEQTGIILLDCEKGHKHVPNFAEVIVRNPRTLEECKTGEAGLIEVISVLGNSYPSQALLTEDFGEVEGIDNCPCGRLGKYIKFLSRVEKVEIRGCGDTFAQKTEAKNPPTRL